MSTIFKTAIENFTPYRDMLEAVKFGHTPVSVSGVSAIHKAQFALGLLADAPVLMIFDTEAAASKLAEDLNAKESKSFDEGSDFDFNDVVFDVKIIDNDNVKITLLAAGGTLPIYVGDVEVHEAFGVETNVMVNTGNGVTAEYVEFEMECKNHNWNANAVPVKVIKNGQEIALEANVGKIPGKMCVKTFYQWCSERQSIEEKYPLFVDYVKDQNKKWY